MTNETPADPTPEPVDFAPAPGGAPGRARRTGRALTWVAVGAIGATVLTGVAFAANDDGSTPGPAPSAADPSTPAKPGDAPPGRPGGRGGPGHGHGHVMFGGPHGDVLHGEFVVKDGDDTKTMLTQTGEVTAASSTALTVRSTDGFTGTWALSSSTTVHVFKASADGRPGKPSSAVSDLKVGQTVTVAGTKSGDTAGAATHVAVRPTEAQLEELRKNAPQRPGRAWGGEQVAPEPAPTASTSAA